MILAVKGLHSNNNELSAAPVGALKTADNLVVNRDSVAECRRGFDRLAFTLPSLSDRADKLFEYQNTLLPHYDTSNLAYYDSNKGVVNYLGSYQHPDPNMARIKSAEANQNLYFTTSQGVAKLDSVTSQPTQAGMFKGLDILASAHTNASGFMANNTQVAYRMLWGITDANDNLILGYPSQQSILSNQTGGNQDASLAITIPQGVTVNHFLQVYRGDQEPALTTTAALTFQDITYTALASGTAGNSVTVAYTGGGTAGSEVVTVLSNAISVQIASGASTAAQVLAAIDGSAAARALVSASLTGQATHAQVAASATNLAGGSVTLQTSDDNMQLVYEGAVAGSTLVLQDITYTSVLVGLSGNLPSIQYTSGGTAGSEVVTVTGNAVSVKIASGVSTATQVLAAINASAAAAALVSGAITGTASNAQTTAGPTNLSGGTSTITIIDSTPDSLKGAALYTNETQEGILQANEIPPYAADMATFMGCLFFGNIKTKQRLQVSVLAAGGTSGIQLGDTITIAGTTYTAASSENVSTLHYQLSTSGSAAQNIQATALSLIRVINQNLTNTSVYAYYVSSPDGLPGQILIEGRVMGGSTFYVTASAHGSAFSPTLPTAGTSAASTNQVALNGLMYSKSQQPEAVPSENILYVGSASKKILRILALRDYLFILKEDGIYYCTGTDPSNFAVNLIDNTAILLAPETAVTLSNEIFALTTQGVVTISGVGVQVLSRPIEDQLQALFQSSLTPLQYYSFGVGYESERQYILWTVSSSGDTSATQAFVYNIYTQAWTRWTRNQQHAIVLTADNKIYAADPLSNYINQERKSDTFADYSDEGIIVNLTAANGTSLTFSDISNISVGDVIYQSVAVSSMVESINSLTDVVTVADNITWDLNATTVTLKAIACTLEWLPNYGQGMAGYLKQWSEAILLIRQTYFNTATLGFYSDISGSVDQVTLTGIGGGLWGLFAWGDTPWGGVVNSRPIRTYVPLEKQRCDLLSVRFTMQEAWARFQVEGVVLTNRPISTRVMV